MLATMPQSWLGTWSPEDRAAIGGAEPGGFLEVLDADRQPVQRRQVIATHHRRLGRLRRRAGAGLIQRHHGVHRRVHRGDAAEAALQQLDGREGLAADQTARLQRGQVAGLGHGASSSW